MKTQDLIRSLSEDSAPSCRPQWQVLAFLGAGVAVAVALFALLFDIRPDAWATLTSNWRFAAKFVVTGLIALLAYRATRRSMCPMRPASGVLAAFALVGALLAALVGTELMTVASGNWATSAMGQNAFHCVMLIPVLSAAPLAVTLWLLREGAPRSPAIAGATAGLLAGGIGAFLYASQCPDDSPLFLAIWYTLAISIVTGVGALAGRRVLAW